MLLDRWVWWPPKSFLKYWQRFCCHPFSASETDVTESKDGTSVEAQDHGWREGDSRPKRNHHYTEEGTSLTGEHNTEWRDEFHDFSSPVTSRISSKVKHLHRSVSRVETKLDVLLKGLRNWLSSQQGQAISPPTRLDTVPPKPPMTSQAKLLTSGGVEVWKTTRPTWLISGSHLNFLARTRSVNQDGQWEIHIVEDLVICPDKVNLVYQYESVPVHKVDNTDVPENLRRQELMTTSITSNRVARISHLEWFNRT